MGYTPITLPTNANLDRSQSEDPPTTPRLLGMAGEFVETMQQLPLADVTTHLVGLYDEKYNPGRFMNFNEIKEAYPLVAGQFKDGGHENVIRDISDKKHKELYNQDVINNMPPGALSGLGKFGSFALANVFSPSNIATGFGVEATIGKLGAMVASKIPETNVMAKFAARGAFGVSEGGLAVTPIALSTSDYYKQLGMPMSPWSTLEMVGWGAGLGGFLRTVIGFKNPIAPEAHENAFTTAQDQMVNGKKVDVGLIVKDGNYKARNLEDPADVEALETIRNDGQKKVSGLSDEIEKERKNFEELSKDKEVSPLEKITDGREIVDRAERLNRIPEESRTAEENSFMKNLPNTDEIKAALTFKNISTDELLPKEQKFLDRFEKGEEPEMLKKNIELRKTKLEKLKSDLDKTSKEDEVARGKIEDEIEETDRRLNQSKDRLKELRKFEREPERVKTSRARVRELEKEHAAMQKMVEDTDSHIALLNSKSNAVHPDEMRAGADKVNSWEGDETTNLSDFNQAEKDAKTPNPSLDEELKATETTIDNLKKTGELGDFEKSELEFLKTEEVRETKINDALRDEIVCEIKVDG